MIKCVSTLENHQRLFDLFEISQNQLKVKLISTNFDWIKTFQGFRIIFYDFWWLSITSSLFECQIRSTDLYRFVLCSSMIFITYSVKRNYFEIKNLQKKNYYESGREKFEKRIKLNAKKKQKRNEKIFENH